MVESQPSKLLVAGSIPVSRSSLRSRETDAARELRLGTLVSRLGTWIERSACLAEACERVGRASKRRRADVAQLAERVLGKDEVTSSILVIG